MLAVDACPAACSGELGIPFRFVDALLPCGGFGRSGRRRPPASSRQGRRLPRDAQPHVRRNGGNPRSSRRSARPMGVAARGLFRTPHRPVADPGRGEGAAPYFSRRIRRIFLQGSQMVGTAAGIIPVPSETRKAVKR